MFFMKWYHIFSDLVRSCQILVRFCQMFSSDYCQRLSDIFRCFSDFVKYICHVIVRCCQMFVICSSDFIRCCQVFVGFCQVMSHGIRYMFDISIQIMSGDFKLCQVPVIYLSDSIVLFQIQVWDISTDSVRCCQILSDTSQILSGCVRYMSEISSVQILSGDIRFWEMSYVDRYDFACNDGSTPRALVQDPRQGPLCRTLARGPCAGPSPGVLAQDPCQVPSCCCYCCCNCQATLGEPGGSADFRQQADCMSVAAVIS